MTESKPLEVIIVGGGVCGLVCAIALARRGVKAHIYEAAAKFGEIGAGIALGQNAINVLKAIDVFEDVIAYAGEDIATTSRAFIFYSGMDSHELVYDYPVANQGTRLGLARSIFLDALVRHIDPLYTHFNKRCTTVIQPTKGTTRPIVQFSDGASVEADIVLLANGIHGVGREAVTMQHPADSIAFSNTICYRGLVPADVVKAAGVKTDLTYRPVCFTGMGRHIIVFPIRGGTVINIVAFVIDRSIGMGTTKLPADQPQVVAVSKEEMLKEYEGWGNDVIAMLSCIEHPTKWYINVVTPPLQTYVNGNVALLGDAAHGMTPHLGAGAGQGIEDAYLLSQLLSDPKITTDNAHYFLAAYDAVRRPRAQSVWEGSVNAADIYEGYGRHGSSNEGRQRDLVGLWDFVWHHGLNDDLDAALKMLGERGVPHGAAQ